MAEVHIVDIDGEQWDIKDLPLTARVAALEEKQSKIIDITLGGTTTFSAKMKYLGEDSNYIYYNFWWEEQDKTLSGSITYFVVLPPNTNTDKILSLNLNILQANNGNVLQRTQHADGANRSGILTYLSNLTSVTSWTISGMGILKRAK